MGDPNVVRTSLVMTRSFTEKGTPWSGPSLAPRRITARSAAFAVWRARSASSVTYAFSCFKVSMRANVASTTSTGDTFFFAIATARSDADIQQSSLLFMVAAIVCCTAAFERQSHQRGRCAKHHRQRRLQGRPQGRTQGADYRGSLRGVAPLGYTTRRYHDEA